MPTVNIIFASTSGHTQYVVEKLVAFLESADCKVQSMSAELAKPEDLLKGDILILASGSWNTGGIEGQMNPYMHAFLKDRAKDVDLKGKKVALIALGDHRYRYLAGSGVHMAEFVATHGGKEICKKLEIINEPYDQDDKIVAWGNSLADAIQ